MEITWGLNYFKLGGFLYLDPINGPLRLVFDPRGWGDYMHATSTHDLHRCPFDLGGHLHILIHRMIRLHIFHSIQEA